MKMYLFGGAELGFSQVEPLKKLIKEIIIKENPKQILHIPFARLVPSEDDLREGWTPGWFKELMIDTNIEILDGGNEEDILKAKSPAIFINGGHGRFDLINALKNNPSLMKYIKNTSLIVSESAGSMAMGQCLRRNRAGEGNEIIDGVGLLKDTIIEPHYTERHSEQLLLDEMKASKMSFGIGIDCVTALVLDPKEFPNKWEKLGPGNVYVING